MPKLFLGTIQIPYSFWIQAETEEQVEAVLLDLDVDEMSVIYPSSPGYENANFTVAPAPKFDEELESVELTVTNALPWTDRAHDPPVAYRITKTNEVRKNGSYLLVEHVEEGR